MIKSNKFKCLRITDLEFKEYKPRKSLNNDVMKVVNGLHSYNASTAVAYVFGTNGNGSAINWGSFEWEYINPRLIYGDIFFMLETVGDLEKGKYYKIK